MKLKGKVALITGAGRGIGKAIALEFAREGASIVVNYSKSKKEADETVNEINKLGPKAISVRADVSKKDEVENMFESSLKEFKRIDILVNNAGIISVAAIEKITEEDWNRLIDVNLKGVFLCSQAASKIMMRQKTGKIINISSMAALWGQPDILPYCMSKGGVAQLTKSLAVEWAKYNIQVNDIAPGLFITPLTKDIFTEPVMNKRLREKTPMGRLGKLEELQGAAIFFASSASDFVTGETIRVDGGLFINGTL